MNVNIKIPQDVLCIIDILNQNGHQAFAVGGCIRDTLLRKAPHDWDITTSAAPDAVKKLFFRTIDTGIKHGTITVVLNNNNYELTTFRIESEYVNNRKPLEVSFTNSLEEDLRRRDFTMNAIAYHPKTGIVDPLDGMDDIKNRIIRAVGNASERFNEDALRMLRAIRFATQLDFELEQNTYAAIKQNHPLLNKISSERIRDEITKILISDHPMKFYLLKDTGLLQHTIPEFEECFSTIQCNPYHIYNVAEHCLYAVSFIEKNTILKWTMLLHDIGKPLVKITDSSNIDHFYEHEEESAFIARNILKRLKFDNKTIDIVYRLILHHDRQVEPNAKSIRKAIKVIGEDIFAEWIKIKEADAKAQNPKYLVERLDKLSQIATLFSEIKQSNQCLSVKNLAINGDDLISMGYKRGRCIGLILNKLLDIVIEAPEMNEKKILIDHATKISID